MSEKPSAEPTPTRPDDRLQLIVSLAISGDFAAAAAAVRGLTDKVVARDAWRRLSEMNANLQRWDEAVSDIENALQNDPDSRQLRLERALLLEQQGNDRAALAEFQALARESCGPPLLLVHLAAQLSCAGRTDEAEALLVEGLTRSPADAALHKQLARLRWQRGAGLGAMREIMHAIERQPRELHLRLVAAELLRDAGDAGQALGLLERGLELAPGSAAFLTSIGVLLQGMNRTCEALPYLRRANENAPRSVAARRNLVPALLRTGAPIEARARCDELLAQFPDDQMLIAQRATALRLLDDEEYRRLYDYPRLVKTFTLRPEAPYANIAEFNLAFARALTPLHRAAQHPLEQSVRGGSQTERHLPRTNPAVAAFFAMIEAPIRQYIADLNAADNSHPLDRRKHADYRIAGSWSVQLRPGGFHLDHVHPRGWLSSAYYIALPGSSAAEPRGGWLKFGESGLDIAGCSAEHFIEPAEGMLVLFPSYMWHGTVPFTTDGARLTAAFDVVPA
ncbi:MAG: putative 2OG-Fe(II) oxygenase [Pseudomonadota bacterium]